MIGNLVKTVVKETILLPVRVVEGVVEGATEAVEVVTDPKKPKKGK